MSDYLICFKLILVFHLLHSTLLYPIWLCPILPYSTLPYSTVSFSYYSTLFCPTLPYPTVANYWLSFSFYFTSSLSSAMHYSNFLRCRHYCFFCCMVYVMLGIGILHDVKIFIIPSDHVIPAYMYTYCTWERGDRGPKPAHELGC